VSEGAPSLSASSRGVRHALKAIYRAMSARRRRHFCATVLLMLIGAAAELLTIGAALPFLALISDPERATEIPAIRTVFDLLGWRAQDALILPATLLLVGAALFAAAARLALTWATHAFVFRLGHEMSVAIYGRVLRQPYLYYVQHNSSEAVSAVEKVQMALFSVLLPVMQAFVAAFIAVFIIAVLVAIDPAAALAAAASMSLLYVGLSLATRKLLRNNSRIAARAHTARVKQVQEGLGGIRDILIDRSQAVFEGSFRRIDDELRRAQLVNNFMAAAPRLLIESAGIILLALLALYMSSAPGGLVRAIPVLGALAIGAQRLLPLLQAVYQGWSRAAGSLQILFDIADLALPPPPAWGTGESAIPARPFAGEIVMERVSFRYPGGRRPALREVDLVVRKGERIGLVGETGSGKSTLLDLLMGLLEPSDGEIRIDGARLDGALRAGWQAQIAHVPQFIYLFDSSIASNIAFGAAAGDIDMDRVRAAAAQAQIASFIEGLPDGFATTVGERGVRLSGGQRQRIGIARALYKRASVLILDEATSALDDETEAAVIEALGAPGAGLTVLMVAHRLSTLAACDRLVRLKAGQVVEVGGYAEVTRGIAASLQAGR
jgi:ATP-binding cassette, subfamily B, bacterial PglK